MQFFSFKSHKKKGCKTFQTNLKFAIFRYLSKCIPKCGMSRLRKQINDEIKISLAWHGGTYNLRRLKQENKAFKTAWCKIVTLSKKWFLIFLIQAMYPVSIRFFKKLLTYIYKKSKFV